MKRRFMLKCAVGLILTKKENNKEYVLLQKRYNTGILDGKYDMSCFGHLEKNETVIEAIIRETKEEIGISINPNDLRYCHTMHANFKKIEYLFIVFTTDKYQGEPAIMEPDKCNELLWCDINDLPNNVIDNRKIMIESYKSNVNYSEFGFERETI